MKKLEILTGSKYKVINKETKQTYFFNAQQLAKFVFKNNYLNYNITEIKDKKLIDYVPVWLIILLMFICYTLSILTYINLNY